MYEGTKGTRVAMALAMGTVAKGQQAKSHEPSFWKAWVHIAKWREQEVDAIKENKAKVFHRRRERLQMSNMMEQWSSLGPLGRYCELCDMWISGPTMWETHKIGKNHFKNERARRSRLCCSNADAVAEGRRGPD